MLILSFLVRRTSYYVYVVKGIVNVFYLIPYTLGIIIGSRSGLGNYRYSGLMIVE